MESIFFNVNGIMHRPKKIIKKVADFVTIDDDLTLKLEPDNKYDPNAVMVFYDGVMIGYVGMDYSEDVAKILDLEIDYECKVVSCFPEWDTDITDSGREVEIIKYIDLMAEITYDDE